MEVKNYLEHLDDPIKKITISLRRLVIEEAPEFEETFKWGMITYYYGYKICAIGAYKNYVNFQLYRTAKINDSKKLLEGTGKEARHIRIESMEKFNEYREYIIEIIKQIKMIKQ